LRRQWTIARDRLAIVAADGVFSYQDLAATSASVADVLTERGDLADARVAFLVPPSFAFVAVQQGIWRAGGIAVPLAVSHPPAELDHVVRDSGASIVVGSGRQAEALAEIATRHAARFIRTPDLLAGNGDSPPFPENGDSPGFRQKGDRRDSSQNKDSVGFREKGDSPRFPETGTVPLFPPDRRAMILYTSGTTGKPKGVVTTHANIAAQMASLIKAWEWTSEDRALSVLPLHHVHGLINVVGCALAAGASCEILPQFETEPAWERLASGDVTVFSAVPTIYHRLTASWDAAPARMQRARSEGAGRVRLMMSGSAALPRKTLDRWREITGHVLLERYGMTELGMVLSNPLHGERRPGFVGTPLPGVDVRMVDDELEVRGPGVFREYWQRPDETAAAFHDGWFRTGDVAAVEHGAYRLLGRRSVDIIKTGGFKVSALEIEDTLREHPSIAECSVTAAPDEEWGERVEVTVELRKDRDLTLGELQEWSRSRLARYKIPRRLYITTALPRNALGKIVKTSAVSDGTKPA
jgi:malonyl-CoA/methylmalonyl-CoA synthetase